MAIISIPTNIEVDDLAAHVALCEQRRITTELAISVIDAKVDKLEADYDATQRIVIGSMVTILTGLATTIIAVIIKFQLL